MARKVDRHTKSPSAPPASGADDLATLMPHLPITICGRDLVVRKYGFADGLRVRALMAPFTKDLGEMFTSGEEALVEDIMDLLGMHVDRVQQAIAMSTGTDVAWVAALGDADADLLLNAWWGVCGLFFVRQVMRRSAERAQRKALAGATSSPNLPLPVSADPSSLSAIPSNSSSSSMSD